MAWDRDVIIDRSQPHLPTTGGLVWPAAKRMAAYLEIEGPAIGMQRQGVTVLELGAGCGWLGILLARNLPHATSICLTEQGGGLSWLENNVRLNATKAGAQRITVAPCDWNDYISSATCTSVEGADQIPEAVLESSCRRVSSISAATGRPWDFILGSDLLYTLVRWLRWLRFELTLPSFIRQQEGCRALPRVMRALATPSVTQVILE